MKTKPQTNTPAKNIWKTKPPTKKELDSKIIEVFNNVSDVAKLSKELEYLVYRIESCHDVAELSKGPNYFIESYCFCNDVDGETLAAVKDLVSFCPYPGYLLYISDGLRLARKRELEKDLTKMKELCARLDVMKQGLAEIEKILTNRPE